MIKSVAVKWEPTKAEVNKIKREHESIALSLRTILPTAISIGEWFAAQKEKAPHGEWQEWLGATFPMIGESTVRMYMQLAQYRPQLEQHFGMALALPDKTEAGKELTEGEIQTLPTIREARKLIADLNKAAQKTKPKKKQKKGKTDGKVAVVENPDIVTVTEAFLIQTVWPFIEDEDQFDMFDRVTVVQTILDALHPRLEQYKDALPANSEAPELEE